MNAPRPASIGQLILGDDFPGMLQQVQQHHKGFARHAHDGAAHPQFQAAFIQQYAGEVPTPRQRAAVFYIVVCFSAQWPQSTAMPGSIALDRRAEPICEEFVRAMSGLDAQAGATSRSRSP